MKAPVSVGESIEQSAFDWFFGVMSAYFVLEAIKELAEIAASLRSGRLAKYLFDAFNLLDLGVFACFGLALHSFLEIRQIYSELNSLQWMECLDMVTFCFDVSEIYESIKGTKESKVRRSVRDGVFPSLHVHVRFAASAPSFASADARADIRPQCVHRHTVDLLGFHCHLSVSTK